MKAMILAAGRGERLRPLTDHKPKPLLDHVLDTFGLMFAGLDADACVAARKAAHVWGQGPEATVIGVDAMYPAPTAAFLNALNGRITAFDDTYERGTMHPGNSVIAFFR